MSAPKAAGLALDFVIFAGDPDDGAEAIPSAKALADFDRYKDRFKFDEGQYGAVTVTRSGKDLIGQNQDQILTLVTKLVRTLPYVIDGEPETALLSESDYGFLFERVNEDVQVSFFKGSDAYDPEEYLLEHQTMTLEAFGQQVVEMGERLAEILKRYDAKRWDSDELGKGLVEFLELGKTAYRAYRLERDRNTRR